MDNKGDGYKQCIERVMSKSLTSHEQVTNKPWKSHEKVMNRGWGYYSGWVDGWVLWTWYEQVMNKLRVCQRAISKAWTSDEQIINKLWTNHEHVMTKSWTRHTQDMEKSWTSHEQVANKSQTSIQQVVNKLLTGHLNFLNWVGGQVVELFA